MNSLLLSLPSYFFRQAGKQKELAVLKSEDALGLTITDNGAGYAFVKRIKPDSVASTYSDLMVGDHIAVIDDVSVVGCRHYEVAKILKQKERTNTIKLSLYEPIKSGFVMIANPGRTKSRKSDIKGKETLRLGMNKKSHFLPTKNNFICFQVKVPSKSTMNQRRRLSRKLTSYWRLS